MIIINTSELTFACSILNDNKLLAFPTETVYGLGGNAYSDEAVAKIFDCKQRSQFNPISVCYPSFDLAYQDVEINDTALLLAQKFLPGSLTIVLKKKPTSKISWLCSAGKDTIGIRVPSNQTAIDLLKLLEFPLAAPSANKSTELSTTTAQDVCNSLRHYEELVILDDGPCNVGIESTIVDLSEDTPKLLREGAISRETIESTCNIKLLTKFQNNGKHYKPKKPLLTNISTKEITDTDALLAFGTPIFQSKITLNLSPSSNLLEAAQNLFSMLRILDSSSATRICVMPIPNEGIGKAINERLIKAAS